MSDKFKCLCGKEITYKDCYRCRICYARFCDECALDHFGLENGKGKVKYKNIFKSIWWVLTRNFK